MFCLFLCVAQMSRHGHTEVSTPSWGAKGQIHVFLPLFKRKKKKESENENENEKKKTLPYLCASLTCALPWWEEVGQDSGINSLACLSSEAAAAQNCWT